VGIFMAGVMNFWNLATEKRLLMVSFGGGPI